MVPIRSKLSKRLISQDDNSNVFNYKYTQYAEVAPVCKDDLVTLDSKLAGILGVGGGGAGVWIVTRVTANITLLDPVTLKMVEVSGGTYWHHPFRALMTAKQLTEYMIIEKQDLGPVQSAGGGGAGAGKAAGKGGAVGKAGVVAAVGEDKKRGRDVSVDSRGFNRASIPGMSKLSLARFTLMKVSEMGVVDVQYECTSHLGHLLHVGDRALGYDIANANIEEDDDMTANQRSRRSRALPSGLEVLLVKKAYEEEEQGERRKFVLKTLVKEDAERGRRGCGQGGGGKRGDERRNDVDMEEFMQEIEEDRELAGKVNLYKSEGTKRRARGRHAQREGPGKTRPRRRRRRRRRAESCQRWTWTRCWRRWAACRCRWAPAMGGV